MKMHKQKISSRFGRLFGADSSKGVEFEGYRWEIGRGMDYPTLLDDLIRFYPLVVKGLVNGYDEVAVSLPAESFIKNKDLVEGLKERIKRYAEKKKVEVLPQGVVSLSYISRSGLFDIDGRVLVIDGGFNTINVSLVESQTGEVIYIKTYYNELGVRDLLERYFREELVQRFPEVSSNLQRLLDIFMKGSIDLGFTKKNITEIKEASLGAYLSQVIMRIKGDLARSGEDFDRFVVVGGLSYFFKDIRLETSKPYYVPDKDGEFYTALGMYVYSGMPAVDFGFGHIKIVEPKREES